MRTDLAHRIGVRRRRACRPRSGPSTTTLVARFDVRLGEAAAAAPPASCGSSKYSGVVPLHAGRPVLVFARRPARRAEHRRGVACTDGDLGLDGLEIVPGERGLRAEAALRAARRRCARHDDEQVGAHRGEGLLDLRLGALADGDHGDDRGDADDDAERGEKRAHLVAQQRAERDAQGVQAGSRGRSSAARGSGSMTAGTGC